MARGGDARRLAASRPLSRVLDYERRRMPSFPLEHARDWPLVHALCHFLLAKLRTSSLTRVSICSAVSFLPKAVISSPPVVTALIMSASLLADHHSASVKSRALNCFPFGVFPV